ncbi:MAG: hypothetical protein MUE50_08265, partial [Pirellulaceae bacterium]|nr:hypothetical protein [Pirellulaceae bacterium]
MNTRHCFVRCWIPPLVLACGFLSQIVPAAAAAIEIAAVQHAGDVDFEKEILPILRQNCLACHSSTKAESDLNLETPRTMLTGGGSGPAVVAGKGAESLLLQVASHQEEPVMPPEGNTAGAKNLTPEQLGLVKLWIDQGATGGVSAGAGVVWQPLPAGVNPIYAVAITPDGQYAAASRANQIFVYHVPSKRALGRLTDPKLLESGLYKGPGVADLDLIQSLAFSPDGQLLASGGFRTAKLWRRGRNVRKAEWPGLDSPGAAVSISRDGRWTAIGQENGKIRVFDAATGAVSRTLEGHTAAVRGVAFRADAAQLISGSQDKTLRVWNLADGQLITSTETPAPIRGMALIGDGKQAATAGEDGILRTWDLADGGKFAKEMKGHTGPITALAAHPAVATQLVSGGQDGTVRLWDAAAGNVIRQLNHGGPVTSVAVRADGQRLASAGSSNTAKLWNVGNGQPVAEFQGDFQTRLAADEAGRAVALAKRLVELTKKDLEEANNRKQSEEDGGKKAAEELTKAETDLKRIQGEVNQLADPAQKALDERSAAERAVDAARRSVERAQQLTQEAAAAIPLVEATIRASDEQVKQAEIRLEAARKAAADSQQPLAAVAFSPDGATLAAAGAAGNIYAFDSESGAALETFSGQNAAVGALAFDAAGDVIAAGANNSIIVWDANPAWQLERVIGTADSADALADRVTALAFNPDGQLLATGSGDPSRSGQLKIWNIANGTLHKEITEPHSDMILALEFSRDGKLLASSAADRFIKTWDVDSGKFVRAFEGHTHHVLGISWSADGRTLASSGADKVIKVWDFRTGDQKRTIAGFTKEVTAIRFLADTVNVAASCGDKNVHVRNTDNGSSVRTLSGPTDFVYGVAASADGKSIVAGGQDSVLRIWNDAGQAVATFEEEQPLTAAIQYSPQSRTKPRPLQIHVLRIDLQAAGFEMAAAVGDDPDGDGPAEAQLTSPRVMATR